MKRSLLLVSLMISCGGEDSIRVNNGKDGQQGLTGKDGERGPSGQSGSQGSRGSEGPVGPQGPQGEPGRDGEDGLTPEQRMMDICVCMDKEWKTVTIAVENFVADYFGKKKYKIGGCK